MTLTKSTLVQAGDVIIYDHVITDTSDSYDVSTGIVTISSRGLYVIHFYAMAVDDSELFLDLYHNAKYICSLHGLADTGRVSTGNSVILDIIPGDQISVKARNQNNLVGTSTNAYTTLSGHMVAGETRLTTNSKRFILA